VSGIPSAVLINRPPGVIKALRPAVRSCAGCDHFDPKIFVGGRPFAGSCSVDRTEEAPVPYNVDADQLCARWRPYVELPS
jgi:hypothetical protein